MSRPRVSIVIPVFDKVEYTTACLLALSEHTPPEDFEVVLVDNGSTDGTAQLLATLEGDVRVVRNEVNRGFAVACNQGAAVAGAPVVVFLNNDTEPRSGWLEALLRVLDERPQVGVVGSRLLFPDGRVQHAGVLLVEDLVHGYPLGGEHVHALAAGDDPRVLVPTDFQAVTAACMAVRRDLFEHVGGFDEGYWNGNEDVDLCLAVGAAGHLVAYEPASVLVHHESVSGPERFTGLVGNVLRLSDKWGSRVVPDALRDENGLHPHPARASRAHRRAWQRTARATGRPRASTR